MFSFQIALKLGLKKVAYNIPKLIDPPSFLDSKLAYIHSLWYARTHTPHKTSEWVIINYIHFI